jgi:hypothetical protein
MRKTPSVFLRDFTTPGNPLTPRPNPEAAWVLAGEGVPRRKWDGTCVELTEDGRWWARREVKPGKATPPGFRRADGDDTTGKVMGWVPMEDSQYRNFHAEAMPGDAWELAPGTYELVGPRIGANPEGLTRPLLIRHDNAERPRDMGLPPLPRDFTGLREVFTTVLAALGWEGIVWHHPDGRLAKLKVRDFDYVVDA